MLMCGLLHCVIQLCYSMQSAFIYVVVIAHAEELFLERQSSGHQDDALALGRLLGEVQFHHLGPAFMEALITTVLGTEGLQRLQHTHGITSNDLWAMNCSSTHQRIEAAVQVLTQHGVDVT